MDIGRVRRAPGLIILAIFQLSVACRGETTTKAHAEKITGKGHAELVGTYFSDDYESRLNLEADGTFGLRLAGELGKAPLVKGSWFLDGTSLSLVADKPGNGRRLFTIEGKEGWNEDAKERLQNSERRQTFVAAYRVCPFLAILNEGVLAATISIAMANHSSAEIDVSQQELRLEQSALDLRSASKNAQSAMRHAIDTIQALRSDPDNVALVVPVETAIDAANSATIKYIEQFDATGRTFAVAGKDLPHSKDSVPSVSLADCLGYVKTEVEEIGYGVVIQSKLIAGSMSVPDVSVEFKYADGSSERRTTDGGWALIPTRSRSSVSELVLQDKDGIYPPARLAMPLREGEIALVEMDISAVVSPPFDKVVLSLEKGDLVSSQYKWRYVRQADRSK